MGVKIHRLIAVFRAVDERSVDFLAGLSRNRAAQRAAETLRRAEAGRLWFTSEEYRTVLLLAALIVPSEPDSPGAKEAAVADRIDHFAAESPKRQEIYARGLVALDQWSRCAYGCAFDQLKHDQQIKLLGNIDRLHCEWFGSDAPSNKLKSMLLIRRY